MLLIFVDMFCRVSSENGTHDCTGSGGAERNRGSAAWLQTAIRPACRKSVALLAGTPGPAGRSVRAGNHDDVAVRVAHPALPMIGPALAVRRVSMLGQHHLHAQILGTLHYRVKVFDLKPEQHAVSVRLVVPITDGTVMMLHFEPVQLQDNLAVPDQLLIFGAAVIAPAAQQTLVPPAACFHVGYRNERLRPHAG